MASTTRSITAAAMAAITRTPAARRRGWPSAPSPPSPRGGRPACLATAAGAGASPPDYFALLGVRPAFSVDAAALTAAYRRLQRAHHPDVAAAAAATAATTTAAADAAATATGRRSPPLSSDELSATINAAYATLRSPAARARYLLRRAGVTLPGDDGDVAPGAGGGGGWEWWRRWWWWGRWWLWGRRRGEGAGECGC